MDIAVYSDIHDNLHNLRLALKIIKERNISAAFCLGDFVSPAVVRMILASDIKTYVIWGNNDGEKFKITQLALESKGKMILSPTEYMKVDINNKKVLLIHRDDLAPSLAKSGDFDAVFYGHNHKIHQEKLKNGCLLANPGEISSHLTGNATFMVWNTTTNTVEEIELKGFISVNK